MKRDREGGGRNDLAEGRWRLRLGGRLQRWLLGAPPRRPPRRVPRATQEQPHRPPPRYRISVGGIRRCRWQSLSCHRGHQSAAFRTVGRSEPLEMLLFPLGFRASPLTPPLLPFRLRRRPLTFLSASAVELSGSRARRPHVSAHPPGRQGTAFHWCLPNALRPPPSQSVDWHPSNARRLAGGLNHLRGAVTEPDRSN